jgi:antitoxin HigA-1
MEKLNLLKGLHPGVYLANQLEKKGIRAGQFALSLGEYPQTLNAIMKTRRGMNTALSLKIEKALGLEEGLLMTLQVFYEIKQEKKKNNSRFKPDLSKFRIGLFWDTDPNNIDWIAQKEVILKRINERGNEQEKNAIMEFYKQLDTL